MCDTDRRSGTSLSRSLKPSSRVWAPVSGVSVHPHLWALLLLLLLLSMFGCCSGAVGSFPSEQTLRAWTAEHTTSTQEVWLHFFPWNIHTFIHKMYKKSFFCDNEINAFPPLKYAAVWQGGRKPPSTQSVNLNVLFKRILNAFTFKRRTHKFHELKTPV